MSVLKHIYRYPIKGLSAQPLSRVELQAKKPFPHDRIFALVRPGAPFDTDNPKWGKKGLFVMLMLEEALARVKTVLDVDTLKLTITQGNRELITANLEDEADRAKVEEIGLAARSLAAQRANPGSLARTAISWTSRTR